MNAVEYCLLHGLKLAGPEHPAILCAQESLSYGALAARVGQFAVPNRSYPPKCLRREELP